MSTPIATSAAAAREAARTSAGQFGTQPLSEADLDLDPTTDQPDPKVWSSADQDEYDAYVEQLEDNDDQSGLKSLEWHMGHCDTIPGKRLAMRAYMDLSHPVSLRYGSWNTAQSIDTLASMGYQDKEDFTDALNLHASNENYIIKANLTVARAAALRAAGIKRVEYAHSPWLTETMRTADAEKITEAMQHPDEEARFAALAGLVDPARGDRAREFFAAGEKDMYWIHSGLPLKELQAMRDTVQRISTSPHSSDAVSYVSRGVSPAQVEAYGLKASWDRPVAELDAWDASPHAPAVLKSLHHRAGYRNVESLLAFADAGITKGADLAVYENRLSHEMGGVEHLIDVSTKLTAKQVKTWADEQGKDYRLSRSEVEGAVKLEAAGYRNLTEAATAYKGSFYGPAAKTDDSMLKASNIAVMGGIVSSGATPTQAKAMTRAGIPPTKIAEHLGEEDYWAAGARYRAAYTARLSSQDTTGAFVGTGTGTGGLFDSGAAEWPITEADYRTEP